jgi:prolyl oligopeptidase
MDNHPPARRGDAVDSFNTIDPETGTVIPVLIPNPYDWLEDVHIDETHDFVTAQNRALDKYLSDPITLEEPQKILLDILQPMLSQIVMSHVPQSAGRYYLLRVSGRGREFPVTFRVHKDALRDFLKRPPESIHTFQSQFEIFHDENDDGGHILISSGVSRSGKHWVYNSSIQGSDWGVIKVKDVDTSRILSDEIHDTKFNNKVLPITWLRDHGFFYQYWQPLGKTRRNPQLRFHILGKPQTEDEVIYEDASNPGHCFSVALSDDGGYAFLNIYETGHTSQIRAARIRSLEDGRHAEKLNWTFDINISNDFQYQWQ